MAEQTSDRRGVDNRQGPRAAWILAAWLFGFGIGLLVVRTAK